MASRDTESPPAGVRPLAIGLTGGIGSGKSAAARLFRAAGVPVIDADEIARVLVAPGTPALAAVVAGFGSDFLTEAGELDRGKLRRLVFSEPRRRRQLESILHPLIRNEINRLVAESRAPYCIVVIPLLLETRQTDLVDRILLVDASPDIRLQRVAMRDRMPVAEIRAIMDTQAGRRVQLAAADDVIDNDGPPEALAQQVRALHEKYMEMAGQR